MPDSCFIKHVSWTIFLHVSCKNYCKILVMVLGIIMARTCQDFLIGLTSNLWVKFVLKPNNTLDLINCPPSSQYSYMYIHKGLTYSDSHSKWSLGVWYTEANCHSSRALEGWTCAAEESTTVNHKLGVLFYLMPTIATIRHQLYYTICITSTYMHRYTWMKHLALQTSSAYLIIKTTTTYSSATVVYPRLCMGASMLSSNTSESLVQYL